MREALGIATSTDKKEVEVLPHVAEGSLSVVIDNTTVQAKGQLPAFSANSNGLAHQALMSVEVHQRYSCPNPQGSLEAPQLSSWGIHVHKGR